MAIKVEKIINEQKAKFSKATQSKINEIQNNSKKGWKIAGRIIVAALIVGGLILLLKKPKNKNVIATNNDNSNSDISQKM